MVERVAVRERPVRSCLHTEEHTHEGVSVRDVVLGVSDGLTVPLVEFMMREELGLVEPASGAALKTSLTIGLSYVAGALVPLFPFLLRLGINQALLVSTATTLTTLFLVGMVKSRYTGGVWWRNGFETMLIGAAAAGAAYGFVRLLSRGA